MTVKEYLNNISPTGYFILDSHQEAMNEQEQGHQHADSDYIGYSYNIHHYNQLPVGAAFLYRRPGKLSTDGKFHIYGGGIVDSIIEIDEEGNVIANIEKAFRLKNTIDQGTSFIENYEWYTREKPGPGWKGFWVNYGMNRIDSRDFWNLVEGQECEIVKEDAVSIDEEKMLVRIRNSSQFTVSHVLQNEMAQRVARYASQFIKQRICNIDYLELNKLKKDIGTAGELIVLDFENKKLEEMGLPYRAEHVAATVGDGLGYDILSYDKWGNEIHIEVKTTKSANKDNFYLSQRELVESRNGNYKYKIYRLYNFNDVSMTADLEIYEGALKEDEYEIIPKSFVVKKRRNVQKYN